ncbi:lipopolysaccharide biosynthesis protein [Arthrobacter sp. STN4]|uniref:lipopolysaccharide biosynthesis protein n=1 Tax=Arthrobacter sp. STN4 TaxID=2923276 RepID=UPI00211A994F|nr:polysaccharide biosynthesis C-terminal domain-containing protein [Arthrobacter sp. STN4]MCQ9163649.1 polysaccharide biosynthesis C-terminal domain-containing protein [Arthrobacter sp. STN4]
MSRPASTPATDNEPELSHAARGGLFSVAGAATSAISGFALTFILTRTFGQSGSGVVLQAIAIFTIALGLARTGMDTTGVWLLPRLALTGASRIRGACTALLLPTLVVGLLVAAAITFLFPFLDTSHDVYSRQLVQAVQATSWLLPCGAVMMVALAATRGLGNIIPYTLIGGAGLPGIRPVVVLVAAAAGGTAVLASVAWAAPAAAAMVLSLLVLWRRIRTHELRAEVQGPWRPDRELTTRIWKFALPRWYSAGVEQSIIWFDVVLVGLMAGSGAAGVYGAASRFVSAGLIISTAMRMVVSPRFSALLSEDKAREVQKLYTTTVTWITMLGVPIYGIFMFFPATIMGWFGEGFDSGALSLVILCIGAIAFLVAGNVDALLTMSGRSGWMAFNKTVVLALNVAGNLVLVPLWGITGAAAAWAFSLVLDSALASVESRIFLDIKFRAGRIFYALAVSGGCVATGSLSVIHFMGRTTASVFVAGTASLILLLLCCWLDRRRLGLTEIRLLAAGRDKSATA